MLTLGPSGLTALDRIVQAMQDGRGGLGNGCLLGQKGLLGRYLLQWVEIFEATERSTTLPFYGQLCTTTPTFITTDLGWVASNPCSGGEARR